MFVRWITRPYVTPGYDDAALSALLVENKRVKGQVRQRHIAYLGGTTENSIRHTEWRRQFWDSVTAAFDKLGEQIDPADRKRFEATIAKRVPRPPPLTIAELEARRIAELEASRELEAALKFAEAYRKRFGTKRKARS